MAKQRAAGELQAAFERLLEFDPYSCLANLCLASAGEIVPDYHRVTATDSVLTEFRSAVGTLLKSYKRNLDRGNFAIRGYDAIAKLDGHEVECVDLNDHPEIKEQIEGLATLSDLAAFSENADVMSSLRFYVIVLEPDHGTPVYCFRSCSPKIELGQSSKIAAFFSGNQFDTFTDSLFLFDRGIDCICHGNDVFVFNKGRFESIFQFFELVKLAASETLETIRTTIPIHNFDDLQSACLNHLQMLKKLKNIAAQPYLSRIRITDIRRVIEEMELDLRVEKHDRKLKIVFDPKNKWEILRLLDDDYLQSIMTGENYEVNSKRNR
jgi:hypothetical protein